MEVFMLCGDFIHCFDLFYYIFALLSIFSFKIFFLYLCDYFLLDLSELISNTKHLELVVSWDRGIDHFSMLLTLICH